MFASPWTEVDGAAVLPGGRLLVHGSQFIVTNGYGSRHGTLAWTDASGRLERLLVVPQADEIFGMAVSASAGAIALGGYSQGTGGYVMMLDADGAPRWSVQMGPSIAVYGVAFAPNGDLVACGYDPSAFLARWTADGALLWRRIYSADADAFSYGIAMTPEGDIVGAGGRGAVMAIRAAPDGTTRWTRSLAYRSPATASGAIAIDAAGSVLLAGRDGDHSFLTKLDSAGNTAWVRTIATSGVDTANAIAVDPAGNALVVGSNGLGSGGLGTGYAALYDPSGQLVRKTKLDWPGIEVLRGVALDPAGNAYVVGSFPTDTYGFQSVGFLAKLDSAGIVQ